ncbi:MAG: hypothetical protein QF460_02400 [Candidatus Nanoarchaeia archaeon]|jgi:type I site-specific restriction endonuclease|nr:hypothetical protein [Candidatus Nanoarchaeia archaeon]
MVEIFGKKDEKKGGDLPELPKPPAFSPSAPASPSPMQAPPSFGPQTSLSEPPSIPNSAPAPPSGAGVSQELLTEDIEKIAESIIGEKWNRVKDELDSVTSWKTEIDVQVKEFKSQLEALDKKVSDAQNAMLGKVDEYNKSLQGVNVEIQAMGKVFEKIIPQFTDNVNRLSDMVGKKSVSKDEEI